MNKFYITLIILTILAGFLRLWRLGEIPVGLHGDEASTGYNAFSLLKTGKDMNNYHIPLMIDQWGDYSPAGYHYLTIPSVALFGLNAFAVRLPGAITGILCVFVIGLLSYRLTGDKNTAILTSAVSTISPWFISASRSTIEGLILVLLVLLGTFFYFRKIMRRIFVLVSLCLVF